MLCVLPVLEGDGGGEEHHTQNQNQPWRKCALAKRSAKLHGLFFRSYNPSCGRFCSSWGKKNKEDRSIKQCMFVLGIILLLEWPYLHVPFRLFILAAISPLHCGARSSTLSMKISRPPICTALCYFVTKLDCQICPLILEFSPMFKIR